MRRRGWGLCGCGAVGAVVVVIVRRCCFCCCIGVVVVAWLLRCCGFGRVCCGFEVVSVVSSSFLCGRYRGVGCGRGDSNRLRRLGRWCVGVL